MAAKRHGQKLWRQSLYFKILIRPRAANFAGIIKTATIIIETTFINVKGITNYILKSNLFSIVKNSWC